jgi:hypothetical protein
MKANEKSLDNAQAVVCFLLINRIPFLPEIAIKSVLRSTNSKIFVGYVNQEDVTHLVQSSRVELINIADSALNLELQTRNQNYQSFENDDFYKLVQLKWMLIREVMNRNAGLHVIYSDLDVFWFRDATVAISKAFHEMPSVDILVQNFTSNPYDSQLCMGFVAFRNVPRSYDIIETCSKLHAKLLLTAPQTGDDEIMTSYYKMNNYPSYIFQLPQSTFPVGNMINNYAKRRLFPGLNAFSPYIFHANFVVGLHKKLLLALIFFDIQRIPVEGIPGFKKMTMRVEILIRKFFIPIRIRINGK